MCLALPCCPRPSVVRSIVIWDKFNFGHFVFLENLSLSFAQKQQYFVWTLLLTVLITALEPFRLGAFRFYRCCEFNFDIRFGTLSELSQFYLFISRVFYYPVWFLYYDFVLISHNIFSFIFILLNIFLLFLSVVFIILYTLCSLNLKLNFLPNRLLISYNIFWYR